MKVPYVPCPNKLDLLIQEIEKKKQQIIDFDNSDFDLVNHDFVIANMKIAMLPLYRRFYNEITNQYENI